MIDTLQHYLNCLLHPHYWTASVDTSTGEVVMRRYNRQAKMIESRPASEQEAEEFLLARAIA